MLCYMKIYKCHTRVDVCLSPKTFPVWITSLCDFPINLHLDLQEAHTEATVGWNECVCLLLRSKLPKDKNYIAIICVSSLSSTGPTHSYNPVIIYNPLLFMNNVHTA